MKILKPATESSELYPFKQPAVLGLEADLQTGSLWRLKFHLKDSSGLVLDSLIEGQWKTWERSHELWKTTCFEAFWGVPGESAYWELNLSPSRQLWNLYRFESYRVPQPPTESFDFELSDIVATRETLECTLHPKVNLPRVEVSLTAVLRTQGQTHYLATKHAGEKPDFHLRESFV